MGRWVNVLKKKATTDVYISFMENINEKTMQSFLSTIAQQLNKGIQNFHLLLSTSGGSVMAGIDTYYKLKALPINLITYNTGSISSVGNLLYLAGDYRYAAPHCSFMFHGVGLSVGQNQRIEEKKLREHLAGLQRDQERLANIVEERCNNVNVEEARNLFLEGTFKTAEEAKSMGLVHEICNIRIPKGVSFISLVFKG